MKQWQGGDIYMSIPIPYRETTKQQQQKNTINISALSSPVRHLPAQPLQIWMQVPNRLQMPLSKNLAFKKERYV